MNVSVQNALNALRPSLRPNAPKPAPAPQNVDVVDFVGDLTRSEPQKACTHLLRRQGGEAAVQSVPGLRLLIAGGPGSGKGTHSDVIEMLFGVPHLSTGQILRDEIKAGTDLGKQAEAYVKSGQLVPDDIMMNMMENKLATMDSFLLDGFPRSLEQAERLDDMLTRLHRPLTGVAALQVSDETLHARLKARGREDDTDEIIANRIKIFHEQTEPGLQWLRDKGLVDDVNGEGKVEEVSPRVIQAIGNRIIGD